MREEGELPPADAAERSGRDAQQAAVQGPPDRDTSPAAGDGAGRKRKHAPIVWHTPPKAARGSGMAHVGSSKGLDALAAGGGAKTAADRAMEELAAFQQQQIGGGGGEEDDGQPFMKPSPSVSSAEEDEEDRGAGKHLQACWWYRPLNMWLQHGPDFVAGLLCNLQTAAVRFGCSSILSICTTVLAGRSASRSPAKRGGQQQGEQHTAPSAQPKRASRWVVEGGGEEEGGGQPQHGREASPSKGAAGGAPGDAVSDAEQPSGGSAPEGGEADGEESPRRPVCVLLLLLT